MFDFPWYNFSCCGTFGLVVTVVSIIIILYKIKAKMKKFITICLLVVTLVSLTGCEEIIEKAEPIIEDFENHPDLNTYTKTGRLTNVDQSVTPSSYQVILNLFVDESSERIVFDFNTSSESKIFYDSCKKLCGSEVEVTYKDSATKGYEFIAIEEHETNIVSEPDEETDGLSITEVRHPDKVERNTSFRIEYDFYSPYEYWVDVACILECRDEFGKCSIFDAPIRDNWRGRLNHEEGYLPYSYSGTRTYTCKQGIPKNSLWTLSFCRWDGEHYTVEDKVEFRIDVL